MDETSLKCLENSHETFFAGHVIGRQHAMGSAAAHRGSMELKVDDEVARLANTFENKEALTSAGTGWRPILRDLAFDVISRGHRIRSAYLGKHGGLEVRLTNSIAQELRDAIAEANSRSLVTCEVCGEPGVQRKLSEGNTTVSCWTHR